jgi:hypothetical protein
MISSISMIRFWDVLVRSLVSDLVSGVSESVFIEDTFYKKREGPLWVGTLAYWKSK